MSLLLPNSTLLEKGLERAITYRVIPESISGFKFRESNGLRLSLIWEFSLVQVNIESLQDRVSNGLAFHRYAGTPYAMKLALSWYGIDSITIEEEGIGAHFSEFQVGFGEIPSNFEINTIISVAKMAAPLRSRMTRMYNSEYDVRRFMLDSSNWGDLLSDHSGVYIYAGSPKLSFGRKMFSDSFFDDYYGYYCAESRKTVLTQSEDRFRLDYGLLDDFALSDRYYDNNYYQAKTAENNDYVGDSLQDTVIRPATFARASFVLSDSVLGELNSCYSGSYLQLNDDVFELSFSYLSENRFVTNNILTDNRLWSKYLFDGEYDSSFFEVDGIRHTDRVTYVGAADFKGEISNESSVVMAGLYNGNDTWSDHRHFDVAWNAQNFYSRIF